MENKESKFWELSKQGAFAILGGYIGAIFGVVVAVKYRKPHQSPLKFGVIIGLSGGALAAFPPSFHIVYFFNLDLVYLFNYIIGFLITGIALGFIFGGIIGTLFKYKEQKEKEDNSGEDEFFQDLKEK